MDANIQDDILLNYSHFMNFSVAIKHRERYLGHTTCTEQPRPHHTNDTGVVLGLCRNKLSTTLRLVI